MKNRLEKLFEPKSIAIVGASETAGKVGNIIAKNIIESDYDGDVFLINPKHEKLFDQESYSALEELPQDVDVAIIVIPGAFVTDVVAAGQKRCKNFVVISAGFSEIGLAGHKREALLMKLALENDLMILGPNCLGFLTPALHLNASFASGQPAAGGVALVSQSGALAVAFLDKASSEGIGFAKVISVGNKMQLDASLLLDYLDDDPATEVIALYLEGINDGEQFLRAAHEASTKKPIIVLKAGRSESAQKAMALHTGSLAGADDVVTQACATAGVARAYSMQEFFALIRLASNQTILALADRDAAPRIAIITNAGGPGVLTTDVVDGKAVVLAQLSDATQASLSKKLPEAASHHNPVDVLGDADATRYDDAIAAVMHDDDVDVLLTLLTPQDQTPVEAIVDVVIKHARKKNAKPIMTSFIGGARVQKTVEQIVAHSIVHTRFPEIGLTALARLATRLNERLQTLPTLRTKKIASHVRALTRDAQKDGRQGLYFAQARELAMAYGIAVSDVWDVTDKKEVSHVRYPCVAKVDDPGIMHKSDRQGVILPIANMNALSIAADTLKKNFPDASSRVIAQPLAPIDQELIIGMKRDQIFGPVIVVGIGGIYTEIFKKTELFVVPHEHDDIVARLERGALAFLFTGARGQNPYDAQEVAHIVQALHQMAYDDPTISAIDINPLLVYNDGMSAVAVDVKVVL